MTSEKPWIVIRGSERWLQISIRNKLIGNPRCSLTPPQTHPLIPSKEGTFIFMAYSKQLSPKTPPWRGAPA